MSIQQMLIGAGGNPLQAFVDSNTTSANGGGFMPQQVTTFTPVTASATGGTGVYTYNWEYVSGDVDVLMVNPGSSAAQRWTKHLNVSESAIAVYRCEVNDGVSTAYTENVTITLNNSV